MSGAPRRARCARCKKEISLAEKPPRGATCPHCGAYLHSCVNCSFYSPGRHNDCREPQAEHVGDKRSANFCDFFRFSEDVSDAPDAGKSENRPLDGRTPGGVKNAARDRFDKLFGS